jgi:ABC-type branched-subunit amino acid transport system substrate-binding protein
VALLLPLSGPQAQTGARLAEAARQAASADAGPSGIRLSVLDTQGTPEGARAAAEAAVQGNAALVLGPLFSVAAQAVRPVLAAADIPVLSLSNNRAVAGGGLYLLGHLPGDQAGALLDHAATQGHGRIAVIGPDTAYARVVAEAARGRAPGLADVRLFPADLDYDSQVKMVREITRTDASGILLPTTGLTLVGLSALFQYYDATPPRVRLLGTDLWEWPGTFAEGSLKGGWYVSSSTPPDWAQAQARDRAVMPDTAESAAEPAGTPEEIADGTAGEAPEETGPPPSVAAKPDQPERPEEPEPEPIRLSAGPDKLARLAMDAVALAEAWAAARLEAPPDGPGSDALTGFLADSGGFRGYSGLFRLLPSGLNERGLHVLEVTAEGPRVVRPAPTAFPGATPPTLLVGPDAFARHPWLAAEYQTVAPPTVPDDGVMPATPVSTGGAEDGGDPDGAPAAVGTGCRWVGTRRVCPPTS